MQKNIENIEKNKVEPKKERNKGKKKEKQEERGRNKKKREKTGERQEEIGRNGKKQEETESIPKVSLKFPNNISKVSQKYP